MTTFETARSSTKTGAAEAVVLPRRHIVAIAVLMCLPLPLLSLAATVVPLPQIVERVGATFMSIAAPVVGTDDRRIREKAVAVRSVEITYGPSERAQVSTVVERSTRRESRTTARRIPARPGASKVAAQVDTSGSQDARTEPTGRVEPTGTSPSAETTDPPTATSAPRADGARPGSADPPTSSPYGAGGGSGPRGGGAGGAGPGGGGTGAGASGANPPDPPVQSGQDPPAGGNGQAEPPAPDPPSGSGSPDPPPAGGDPPDTGRRTS